MGLEQFDAHKIRPAHYQELAPTSQRGVDIIRRLRVHGDYDPDVSVAYETLCVKDPAYRLTRDFVRQVLEEVPKVTSEQRDEWLDEVVLDTWTYDIAPYAEPGETFESYYQSVLDGLLVPTPMDNRENPEWQLFSIDGLPKLYLTEETYESITDLRYFIDLGPAVVPVPLPHAYYIL